MSSKKSRAPRNHWFIIHHALKDFLWYIRTKKLKIGMGIFVQIIVLDADHVTISHHNLLYSVTYRLLKQLNIIVVLVMMKEEYMTPSKSAQKTNQQTPHNKIKYDVDVVKVKII